ncbi:ornithine cyclodeaminase family protein [Streptomyces sp. NPDC003027]
MREELLFLDRHAVRECAARVDLCAVTEEILRRHAEGRTTLPSEGYLPWTNTEGAYCRSLAMLGSIDAQDGRPAAYGVKLINAATSNPAHGLERAAGVSMVFDPETARPTVLAEAGWLSAARTAAYTMVSLRHLGPADWDALTVIGCGTLARAHLDLLAAAFPGVDQVHLHDLDRTRALALAGWAREHHPRLRVRVHEETEKAVRAAPVLLTTTTTDRGYIPAHWLASGTFVAHVSLDDLLPDVFSTAQALYVDDVSLVAENPRRVLGRLMGEGYVLPPSHGPSSGEGRPLEGTLGQVLTGAVPAVRPSTGHVVSNPFGMSVLDVGLLAQVRQVAEREGLGQRLSLF